MSADTLTQNYYTSTAKDVGRSGSAKKAARTTKLECAILVTYAVVVDV